LAIDCTPFGSSSLWAWRFFRQITVSFHVRTTTTNGRGRSRQRSKKKIQRPDVADERVELSGAALSGARTSVLTQNIGGMVARSSSASCSTTATRRRCLSYIAACALVAIGTVVFGMSGRRTV
jgi:hypothetical protein